MNHVERQARLRCRAVSLLVAVMAASTATGLWAQDEPPVAKVPEVLLSEQHAKLCLVRVGDPLPNLELPTATAPSDEPVPLKQRLGEQATVVLFWRGEGYMAKTALRDLAVDVVDPFAKRGVQVAAVAVDTPVGVANELTTSLGFEAPVLVDGDGSAFAEIGTGRMPRLLVLDSEGQIVWFDIEYSRSTRRDMMQTLDVLAPVKP